MNRLSKITPLFALIFTGCSWVISPYLRNHTENPIQLTLQLKNTHYYKLNKDELLFRWTKGIKEIDRNTYQHFTDSSNAMVSDDSLSAKINLQPNSTSSLQMPYRWTSDCWIIAKYVDGTTDTLNTQSGYTTTGREDKKPRYPGFFSKKQIYFDFK